MLWIVLAVLLALVVAISLFWHSYPLKPIMGILFLVCTVSFVGLAHIDPGDPSTYLWHPEFFRVLAAVVGTITLAVCVVLAMIENQEKRTFRDLDGPY